MALLPILTKLAPSIISGAASLFGHSSAEKGQEKTNKENARQAKLNRDFQERMSNTSHQREIKDLYAAGLNPILSAKMGASSPAGATSAPMQNTAKAGMETAALAASTGLTNALTGKAIQDARLASNNATGKGFQNIMDSMRANLVSGLGLPDAATKVGTTAKSVWKNITETPAKTKERNINMLNEMGITRPDGSSWLAPTAPNPDLEWRAP